MHYDYDSKIDNICVAYGARVRLKRISIKFSYIKFYSNAYVITTFITELHVNLTK